MQRVDDIGTLYRKIMDVVGKTGSPDFSGIHSMGLFFQTVESHRQGVGGCNNAPTVLCDVRCGSGLLTTMEMR